MGPSASLMNRTPVAGPRHLRTARTSNSLFANLFKRHMLSAHFEKAFWKLKVGKGPDFVLYTWVGWINTLIFETNHLECVPFAALSF